MWRTANRGDPRRILDYIRVKESDHVVSHLHVPNKDNHMKEEGISPL